MSPSWPVTRRSSGRWRSTRRASNGRTAPRRPPRCTGASCTCARTRSSSSPTSPSWRARSTSRAPSPRPADRLPRLRLGVALVVPPPVGAEVDGLRRACGDGALGRIPPHCTLVPPVNLREDRISDALAHLRDAASTTRPFTVELGPADTFVPDSPVLYLAVGGDGLDALLDLRDRVFSEPLSRPVTWPFVPHVTLAEGMEAGRI